MPLLKIKRTFRLFQSPTRNAMCVNHRGSHVTVTEKRLDRPDVIIGLKKVSGETVAKGYVQRLVS